jgi:hypothetical protein
MRYPQRQQETIGGAVSWCSGQLLNAAVVVRVHLKEEPLELEFDRTTMANLDLDPLMRPAAFQLSLGFLSR